MKAEYYDVFNGDADGLCALLQWRLKYPKNTELVTGVKRHIKLLQEVPLGAEEILVLDISLDKNRQALESHLAAGSQVSYFDHHFSGDIPKHDNLVHYIDTKANTCTSLIVNKYLQSAFPEWAIVGAYGDNMHREANALSDTLLLTKDQKQQLQELGSYLNYNAYGGTLDDLHIHPDQLYRDLSSYGSPFYFIEQNPSLYERLQKGYERDMACAQEIEPQLANESLALLVFPDQAWARRTSGVYANDLANQFPDRAHAILTEKGDAYLVSVRAPMNRRRGADELCMKFPGGGGRKAAAGIHFLAESSYESFIEEFKKMYQS